MSYRNFMKWKFRLACWSFAFVCRDVCLLFCSRCIHTAHNSVHQTLHTGTNTSAEKNWLGIQGHWVKDQSWSCLNFGYPLIYDRFLFVRDKLLLFWILLIASCLQQNDAFINCMVFVLVIFSFHLVMFIRVYCECSSLFITLFKTLWLYITIISRSHWS